VVQREDLFEPPNRVLHILSHNLSELHSSIYQGLKLLENCSKTVRCLRFFLNLVIDVLKCCNKGKWTIEYYYGAAETMICLIYTPSMMNWNQISLQLACSWNWLANTWYVIRLHKTPSQLQKYANKNCRDIHKIKSWLTWCKHNTPIILKTREYCRQM
jgi:hypothetical protein